MPSAVILLVLTGIHSNSFLKVEAKCSFPGTPGGGEINGRKPIGVIFEEGQRVTYACSDPGQVLLPFESQNRTCDRGKWTGSLPICGRFYFITKETTFSPTRSSVPFLQLKIYPIKRIYPTSPPVYGIIL